MQFSLCVETKGGNLAQYIEWESDQKFDGGVQISGKVTRYIDSTKKKYVIPEGVKELGDNVL